MRYYQIRILDVNGLPVRTWSSLDDQGNNLAGALNIEIDAPVFNFANPNGNNAGGNAAAQFFNFFLCVCTCRMRGGERD